MDRKEFRQHLKRLSITPFLLLLLVATALTLQIFRQRQVALSVEQSDRAISDITHLMKLLVDMESGLRGYLLGGRVVFLEPYERAIGSIQSELTALRESEINSASIRSKLDRLENSMEEWLVYSRRMIEKKRAKDGSNEFYMDDEGKHRMDAMRLQIEDILQSEEAFRSEQRQNHDHQLRVTIIAVYFLSLLSAFLIGIFARREADWIARSYSRSLDQIRKESEQFRAIFNGVKDHGMALLDKDGTIQAWNPGAEKLTGYPASDAVGKKVSILYALDDIRSGTLASNLDQASALGKYEGEGWRVRKDGSRYWAEFIVTALWESNGKLRGFTSVFRDHSKRRQVEEERAFLLKKLEEGVKSRDDFLSLASHELKTPITSMALQLQSIQREARKKEPESETYCVRKSAIDGFQRQSLRLTKLIESMLDMVRVHSGNLPMEFKVVSLSDLVQGVLEDYRVQFSESGCPLDPKIEAGLTARCDSVRIEQTVTNLLLNAHKYACAGPIQVVLKKSADGKNVVFSVKDQGQGIPQEHQDRIFERYGRIGSIHDASGLGLGLYIAKEFIEAHDGRIWLESEPGRGSTFSFEIPLYFE